MPLEPDADLPWTAYLYVTGELPAIEEAAFELRLAEDQVAREAVAEAVELAGALAAVEPRDWTRHRERPIRRVLAWSALAAAASLVVASLWGLRAIPSVPPDTTEVAIAWSGLRRLDAIGGGEVDFIALTDESHPTVDLDAPSDPALPSWLLTAAAEPRLDAPQEEN
jgi:hypothetical protein